MIEYTALLQRLERENRRLKVLVVMTLVLLAAGGITAQLSRPATRVEAQEFFLTNEGGRVRAVLGHTKDFPTLSFFDPETEDLGMVIGMTSSGAVLGVVQPDGTFRNYLDTPAVP